MELMHENIIELPVALDRRSSPVPSIMAPSASENLIPPTQKLLSKTTYKKTWWILQNFVVEPNWTCLNPEINIETWQLLLLESFERLIKKLERQKRFRQKFHKSWLLLSNMFLCTAYQQKLSMNSSKWHFQVDKNVRKIMRSPRGSRWVE